MMTVFQVRKLNETISVAIKNKMTNLRPARPHETHILTNLARQSKAYWGYDADFLRQCWDDLTVTPTMIAETTVYEHDGELLGFVTMDWPPNVTPPQVDMFFVAPSAIGQGIGRALWHEAVAQVRSRGYASLDVIADPNAQPFYEHMGAVMVLEVLSSCILGRTLPLMRYSIEG